jgi:hypothetical protein
MASPVVVAVALLVEALAAFCGTDPLRTGFESHLVDLPDPAEMPTHAAEREQLRGADVRPLQTGVQGRHRSPVVSGPPPSPPRPPP